MQTLLRLRELAVDGARRDLATALHEEATATAVREAIERAAASEREVGRSLTANDPAADCLVAFLARMRAARAEADAAAVAAGQRSDAASDRLADARSASRAVQNLLTQREARRRLAEAREEQAELDAAGGRAAGRRNRPR